MTRGSPDRSSRPFTLVVCGNCHGSTGDSKAGSRAGSKADERLDPLRRAVRACPHGVMVSTGCLGGLLHCRRTAGLHAAVQPCAEDRRPNGDVVRLGPITGEADAEAIGAWLRSGMPDDGTLPRRLRTAPAPRQVAPLN
ncbi:hypothetical protein [Streptomyces albicerus]|uniref:hypothetical protein n=1 Tax=Streptomyces albicerus TaxID=2569859 RepID=UPI00124B13CB|nr:hypothetical protein [Streptomyces albicerus]